MRLQIHIKLLSTQSFHDLEQLIVVITPSEEMLLSEDLRDRMPSSSAGRMENPQSMTAMAAYHRRKHAANTPHIYAIVISLVPNQ